MKHLCLNKSLVILIVSAFFFNPLNATECYPEECCSGDAYYNCQRACKITVALGLGVLVFAGMIIIIGNDGKNVHSH